MKRALLAAVLAVSSFATLANTSICESRDGSQQVADLNGTVVHMNGQDYNFVQSKRMGDGTELYIFVNTKKTQVLGMAPLPNKKVQYVLNNSAGAQLDSGYCQ